MRTAWLLIALLAAPLALAQGDDAARPTLAIEPAVLDVAPGAQAQARVAIANPLARELLLELSAVASEGAKARFAVAQVRLPPGGSESVTLTALVPNATDVTHTVTVRAIEPDASARPAAAAPVELHATLTLRVPAAKPGPRLELTIAPTAFELAPDATARGVLHVRNLAPTALRLELVPQAPPGLVVELVDAPALVGPGGAVQIAFVVRDALGEARGPLVASIGLAGKDAPRASFEVHVRGPPAAAPPVDDRLVAAGSVVAVAGAWTALWLTRRDWWPLLLALYTRLRPSRILDHPVRRRIADLVAANPGVSFSELARLAQIAPGQLTHHARMLEKAGVVFSSPDGQTRRFFHVGAGRLAAVAPLPERALDLLRERPRRASELARDLGVSRQALHYHLKRLVDEGHLVARAEGRETWLEVAAAQQASSASSRLARS